MLRKFIISLWIIVFLISSPAIDYVYSQDLNLELRRAAEQDDTTTVEVLLAKGADVNAENNEGGTALMYATEGGHKKIVELLKKAGAKR